MSLVISFMDFPISLRLIPFSIKYSFIFMHPKLFSSHTFFKSSNLHFNLEINSSKHLWLWLFAPL